jgi:FAD:protein FMN transferase
LLASVLDWSARTGRAFDPTVLPLVQAWDLRGSGRVPDAGQISRAMAAMGREQFRVDAAMGEAVRRSSAAGIDEGAWGKGYALDRAEAVLRAAAIHEALLDLGGQVTAIGPATIAVADPRDRDRPAVSLEVLDRSVSTSGNSERGFRIAGRSIGHLLDPRTGSPAPDFGSVTVVAPSGLEADILSTAFFVLGPEEGMKLSRRLREEGFENEALFLIVRGGAIERRASPGLNFHDGKE